MMQELSVLLLNKGIIFLFISKRGANGALRLKSVLARKENKGLEWAMKEIEDIKQEGNHITNMLSYADLI